MTCKLTRVASKSFRMTANPLSAGDVRFVQTSAIMKIEEVREENTLVLTTKSGSVYLLEMFEVEDGNRN